MSSPIHTIAVVGTGVIGSSWTALFLAHGLRVLVADPAPSAESKLRSYLSDIWSVLPKTSSASIDNLEFVGASLSPEHLSSVDFIQENGPEKLELKKTLIASLDESAASDVPIVSSSSGLVPSSFIGECKKAPERVLVGHPWNPPHIIPLVEIVPHTGTSNAIIDKVRDFYAFIDKKPIVLHKEAPGFVGNRLQAAMMREAYSLVANGICGPEDVEVAMTQALGPRWALTGPFMTNVLGGGGNPEGYTRMMERLGPAFKSWEKDMDRAGKIEGDEGRRKEVTKEIEEGLGRVDTKVLERQRDEVLRKFLETREAKEELENYARKE